MVRPCTKLAGTRTGFSCEFLTSCLLLKKNDPHMSALPGCGIHLFRSCCLSHDRKLYNFSCSAKTNTAVLSTHSHCSLLQQQHGGPTAVASLAAVRFFYFFERAPCTCVQRTCMHMRTRNCELHSTQTLAARKRSRRMEAAHACKGGLTWL